jgi:ABC-type Fe3+-hydroxamate transport system substrate-binding protein
MTDETLITIEEMAKAIADELMQKFGYEEQNQCWLLIRQRLIADREKKIADAKEAMAGIKGSHKKKVNG